MNTNERITEAMSIVHASDDFTERVFKRVSASQQDACGSASRARPKRGSAWSLRAVAAVAAAAIALTSGIAYAVANSDFFQQAWSDHGLGSEVAWSANTGKSSPGPFYRRDMGGTADEEMISELPATVEEVGLSVEGCGYTLAIESMVVDENGCGAASFTLANENGLVLNPDYGTPGQLVFDATESSGLDSIGMTLSNGDPWLNARCFYDEDTLTATSLEGTMYFSAFNDANALRDGVRWTMSWHEGEGSAAEWSSAATESFMPTKTLQARSFFDDAGNTLCLSPLSLITSIDQPEGSCSEFIPSSIAIELADGTERIVQNSSNEGTSTVNTYIATSREAGCLSYVLTQLVDVNAVERIVVAGSWPTGVGAERIEATYEVTAA